MKRHERQQLAWTFLKGKSDGTAFVVQDLADAAHWKPSTAETYATKHYKDWIARADDGSFSVLPEFRRVTEEQFVAHSDQTRRVYEHSYEKVEYDQIAIYEFLLPLTRETELRSALDDLFYEDTIRNRLEDIGVSRLEEFVERIEGEADEDFLGYVLGLVQDWFGGYSISLVSGRFRAANLHTRRESVELRERGKPYLIDETTAVVRFIVPLHASTTGPDPDTQSGLFDPPPRPPLTLDEEAELVRELFFATFVEAVVKSIQGEDAIWLIEESPLGRRLHAWEKRPAS